MPDTKRRFRALVDERQSIRAEAPTARVDGNTAVIRLYDIIDDWGGYWGVAAREFVEVLDELPSNVDRIELHINSPGGVVFEAVAMMNALRAHKAHVVAIVDGLAASAASFIACAADELVMGRNSELMIHDPWGVCVGNANDMRDLAERLDHLADNIASVYLEKAGGELTDWRAAMAAETWYSADEAVAAGLADRVDAATEEDADEAKNRFDLSIFNFAGRSNAPAPRASATPPEPSPSPGRKGASAMDLKDLREALGLPEDTSDDDVIVAAIDKATEPAPPEPEPEPAKLPDGVVAISQAKLDELTAKAEAGEQARSEQLVNRRTTLVDAAIKDGRIAPAERDGWLAKLVANAEGAEKVLATLKPGLVPVDVIGKNDGDLENDDVALMATVGWNETEVTV